MFENRNQKVDLTALGLLAVTIFLALSLGSYNAADPLGETIFPLNRIYSPDPLVHPPAESITNLCGLTGAFAADILLASFGMGAYYLVLSLGAVAVVLLWGVDITAPVVRVIGWVFSLLGFTTLANMLLSSQWTGPTMGAGGNLGALCEGLLHLHFATAGSFIFATSVLIAGLLLCTDYLLVQFLILVGLVTVDKTVGRQLQRRRDRAESSVKSPKSKERGKSGKREIPIRIGGRDRRAFYGDQVDPDEDEHGWVELDEDAYDDDEFEDQDEHDLYDDQDDNEFDEDEELADEDDAALSNTSVSDDQSADVSNQKSTKRSGKRRSLLPIRKPSDKEDAREEVIAQLEEASRHDEQRSYDLPPTSLLIEPESFSYEKQEKEIRRKARILEKTFKDFGLNVKVVDVETGPVIAQYEIELEAGLRLSKITGLADDLAIALRVPSVRIVAPIPGKNTVGIEVPNEERQTVRLREVMEKSNGRIKKMGIPLFLGKDVSGNPLTVDLSSLPHLLIAGRTGTGKSVCLNAIISSILMTRRPDEVRMLMIDPKMVELSGYRTLPHLMHPVVTDMRKAEAILAWAVDKMEERYQLLAQAGVRHMAVYNQLGEEELLERLQPETDEDRDAIPRQLPYIVIVADEMADLMMTAGKEVEQHIIRLAQKSRAVGIHLILATQKPTVDVITGLIKSNLPARIAFQVASRTDSRVVLDEMGADKLLGNGDMLFLWPGTSSLLRGQGTYLDDDEINSVVEFVSTGEQNFVKELVQLKVERPGENNGEQRKEDPLYDNAVEIVIREGRGSVSLLQRNLGIGYGRAARLIDYMAEDGIVGTYAGSQAREVLMSLADWEAQQAGGTPEPPTSAARPAPKRLAAPPLPTADEEEEDEDEVDEGEQSWEDSEEEVAEQDEDSESAADDASEYDEYEEDEEYESDEYEYEYEDGAVAEGEEVEYEDEPEDYEKYADKNQK